MLNLHLIKHCRSLSYLRTRLRLFLVLNPDAPQIRGVPLRCVSRSELRAVLRSRRSVDAERSAGGHAGCRGDGSSKARADRLLPAAGGQRPAGGQRGAGPVDGHCAVTAAVSYLRTEWNE